MPEHSGAEPTIDGEQAEQAEQVDDALEILLGDRERTGRLTSTDVARVCSKRELSSEQIDELARRLSERGIGLAEEDIPESFDGLTIDERGPKIPRLPILTAEEEKRLGHLYRTAERLKGGPARLSVVRLIQQGEEARNLPLDEAGIRRPIPRRNVWPHPCS
jgi:hypothetical protein